jgi:hypothetical protein
MKLEIIKIIDRGIALKERLWLRVLNDTDLSFYIVFNTIYLSTNSISSTQKNAYWFAPQKVKTGDYIILYTGSGTPSNSKNADGTTNYFFYWGLPTTVWNIKEDCAVVFEINLWKTTPMG